MENTQKKQHRLAIIGGGPVGIEFAVRAASSGEFTHVTVLEAGGYPCAHVRKWAHVRLFSPWALNASKPGLAALDELAVPRPTPTAFPTGADLCAEYFDPLWRWLGEGGHAGCAVSAKLQSRLVSVTRGTLLKGDMKGRAGVPFRLLVASPSSDGDGGEDEHECEADVVVDASGTFGQRNWIGQGGSPAVGERALSKKGHVLQGIPNVAHDPAKFVGKTTMVVGSGYSAITFIAHLKRQAEASSLEAAAEAAAAALESDWVCGASKKTTPAASTSTATKVIWVTRKGGGTPAQPAQQGESKDEETKSPTMPLPPPPPPPSSLYARIADDPLPERDALAKLANSFVEATPAPAPAAVDAAAPVAAHPVVSFVVEHRGGHAVRSLALVAAATDDGNGRRCDLTGVTTSQTLGAQAKEGTVRVTLAAKKRSSFVAVAAGSAPGGAAASGEVVDDDDLVEVEVECNSVLAAVGYRPDTSLFQELQVHQCYATEGPMKLAAALLSAGGGGGDCLSQVVPGPATLVSPEPGFLVLGMKSYGRGSAFLLKVGHEQCDMALELLKQQQEQ